MQRKKEARHLVNSKPAQIWVETVIYTLIGLVIIAAVTAFATPKINQMKDRAAVQSTEDSLNLFNKQMQEALAYAGGQREVLLSVKKGEYFIDAENDNVYYFLKQTSLKYSQPDVPSPSGDLTILTSLKSGKGYEISLMLNYSGYNLTYEGKDLGKTLTAAPVPYRILLVNNGNRQINIEQI